MSRSRLKDANGRQVSRACRRDPTNLSTKDLTPIHRSSHFPDDRAVFSADVLQVRRLPGGITPMIGSWIDALRIITEIDFDHALTGHAQAGTKKDAADLLRYLEELAAGVAAGVAAGRTLAEIQKTLTLDSYKSWERWDTNRETHIATVYASLAGSRSRSPARTGTP